MASSDGLFIPTLLLDYLERCFPNRCPRLSDDERVIWFKAGQRAVVDHLAEIQRDNASGEFTQPLLNRTDIHVREQTQGSEGTAGAPSAASRARAEFAGGQPPRAATGQAT